MPLRLGLAGETRASLGDPLEREARRVASDGVSAPPKSAAVARPERVSFKPSAQASEASVGRALAGPGSSLEPTLRQEMERRLGHDFSRVRIHASSAAEESTRELNAQAYTVGNDIVFGRGRFAPATPEGRRLLVHELVHVAQQSRLGGYGRVLQPKAELSGLPPILLYLLTGMDNQGEMILGTYLYGGGGPHTVFDDPMWTPYMMQHPSLRRQILLRLLPDVREIAGRGKGRYPIVEQFHAEFPENTGFSGYALLHGSNKDVGDFQIFGWAEVEEAVDPAEGSWDIELELTFVFNDIVDPNKNYWMDRIRNAVANIFTFGQPASYDLAIGWRSSCLAEVRGGSIELYGYPSDLSRPLRPLPRAKLDLPAYEKKRAQETEAAILSELHRNIAATDVKALAERRKQLLWMFYDLGGYDRYWGTTYLERITKAAPGDPLPRLLHDRVSNALRAELLEALHGKRPAGEEPL